MSEFSVNDIEATVRFEKSREIGQEGRNSRVFIAHDKYLDAEIVVKEIPVPNDGSNNLEHYLKEARILYRSTHPFVAAILYACVDNTPQPNAQILYLAMPYYREGSLKQYLKRNSCTVKDIVRFSVNFLSGLHNIHTKHLVHGDIKPDNILINDRGEALLSDFGLATHLPESGIVQFCGAYVLHIPPEILSQNVPPGKPIFLSYQSDIYQVGLTLFRLCIGEDGFKSYLQNEYNLGPENGSFQKDKFIDDVISGKYPKLTRDIIPLHIPNKLISIIKKCVKPNPEDRYNSVLAIINDLNTLGPKGLQWSIDMEQSDTTKTVWVNDADDRSKIVFIVQNDNSGHAYRENKADGSQRRITKMCKMRVTNREAKEFFEEYP